MVTTNSKITTPIGNGVCQGRFGAKDNDAQPAEKNVLVRISITEKNQHILGNSNCLTPRARQSALFVFAESEIQL